MSYLILIVPTQLYGCKYSNQIITIITHSYGFKYLCYILIIRICKTYIECSYIYIYIYIYIEHRNPETRKTLTTSQFRYETFYYLWVKRFFDIRKRETQSFYDDFSICPKPRVTPDAKPRWASESQPSSSEAGTQLSDFSQISAHASGAWRHSHPWSYPLSGIFIATSLNDTSAPRAGEHLRSCLHLINPCTEPRGSQPN